MCDCGVALALVLDWICTAEAWQGVVVLNPRHVFRFDTFTWLILPLLHTAKLAGLTNNQHSYIHQLTARACRNVSHQPDELAAAAQF